jgi:hypothetical protein
MAREEENEHQDREERRRKEEDTRKIINIYKWYEDKTQDFEKRGDKVSTEL